MDTLAAARNEELDRTLRSLAERLALVVEDWAEPANAREINRGGVKNGISVLRAIAEEAEFCLRR